MAEATFKDLPELFEVELGEVLTARTESLSTFRELGPPDLCHVVKSVGKSGQRDLGSYHYVSGVDASSSASLAAYINSLTYSMEDNAAWFSKAVNWKIRNGCYCCFNAFSRMDMRVDVKIPGGVLAYVVDVRGERHEATPEMWQETFLSAVLRAIHYSDDQSYWLEAYRKLDPILTPENEIRFLVAAEALFFNGWQVGSEAEIQVATVVSNHLTTGIMKYFGDSFRFQQAANLFEKLSAREPEVASLLAQSYIGMNEEVKAVGIMANALREIPQSYSLLLVQSEFLRGKGKLDWALKLARQAVNCAPSEFVTWEKLTEIYLDQSNFESALLTLNSCPMFTYNGRDSHRNITPARTHLPPKPYLANVLPPREKTDDDIADQALLRLPAPGLRGTWARAYKLLTRLVSQIGWDELLKTRSAVFVMEEEYRMAKAQSDIRTAMDGDSSETASADPNHVIHEDGTVESREEDDASTRVLVSPPARRESWQDHDAPMNEIPTIKISTESDGEREREALRDAGVLNGTTDESHKPDRSGEQPETEVNHSDLEKPVKAQPPSDQADEGNQQPVYSDTFAFSNKRLCERWLDNLFMVLYEDLRVWTIYRAEVAHFKTQHLAYRKTSLEWEILGDLGIRLYHKEEAKECFARCLDGARYSPKPWQRLLEIYPDEGNLHGTLTVATRVAAYLHADYTETTYPTSVAHQLFKLGQIHGHAKISYTLMSLGLPEPVLKILEGYMSYGKRFKVEGFDY